jgi:hypothetical protein
MPFVPSDFVPPEIVECEGFVLRPIHMNDTAIDYDAVMTSIATIRDSYWRAPGWPQDDLSFMQDLIDLAWHTKERQFRTSFVYIPVTLDGKVQLGAVYIDPSVKEGFDANVQMWVRESESTTGFEDRLFRTVKDWIARDWPFEHVAYPGKEISREEWGALPATPYADWRA